MNPRPLTLGGRIIPQPADHLNRYAGLPWSGGGPEVWAFAYYDAIPTLHDSTVTSIDVLCAAALHPGLRRLDLEFFVRHHDDLAAWLRPIPIDIGLGQADLATLAHLDSLAELAGDVSLTLLTKVLHRKRPHLIPLLDRHVIEWYRLPGDPRRLSDAWPLVIRRLRDDLQRPETEANLKTNAARLRTFDGNRCSMIRCVDIAIWMEGR